MTDTNPLQEALTDARTVKLALYGGPVTGRQATDAIKRVIAKLDAALRAVGVAEQWRPIETAPRDGTPLWLVEPGESFGLTVAHQYQGMWLHDSFGGDRWEEVRGGIAPVRQPTHWMPLPAPPTEVRTLSGESLRSATTYAAPKGDQHDSTKEKL